MGEEEEADRATEAELLPTSMRKGVGCAEVCGVGGRPLPLLNLMGVGGWSASSLISGGAI
jgi:hypothetical protein